MTQPAIADLRHARHPPAPPVSGRRGHRARNRL